MAEYQWNDDDSPNDLYDTFTERRFADAESIVKSLLLDLNFMPRQIPAKTATRVLSILRSNVRFDLLYPVADTFYKTGQTDPKVKRQLAQACIEQKNITKAIYELNDLKKKIEGKLHGRGLSPEQKAALKEELGETLGLLGRSYKQLYIDANPLSVEPRNYDLDKSLEYYHKGYKEQLGDFLWHGVNYVALLTHRERIKSNNDSLYLPEAQEIAKKILEHLEIRKANAPLPSWDIAKIAEAHLALGSEPKEAIKAVNEYLSSNDLNLFQIQSTQRQFIQIWGLKDDKEPGHSILSMMSARLAELGGGITTMLVNPVKFVPKENFERVWGKDSYKPLEWYSKALMNAACVARLGYDEYSGLGTGFLFDGAWIGDAYKGKNLLLTNAHVCTNDPGTRNKDPGIPEPSKLCGLFMAAKGGPKKVKILNQVWTSSPDELDATLLEISEKPEGSELPRFVDRPISINKNDRLNIIGHPGGMSPQLSLHDNQYVGQKDAFVWYKTPTDPGSSGSPVFDNEWNLVALHHRANDWKMANEGVLLDYIIKKMKTELSGANGT